MIYKTKTRKIEVTVSVIGAHTIIEVTVSIGCNTETLILEHKIFKNCSVFPRAAIQYIPKTSA
jgi:hypothetical protein